MPYAIAATNEFDELNQMLMPGADLSPWSQKTPGATGFVLKLSVIAAKVVQTLLLESIKVSCGAVAI